MTNKEALDELFDSNFDYCKINKENKETLYKTIVSVLLYKNDSITKIKYFKNSITWKIHLYIHFEGNKYCWFELPYDDFKEVLEDDTPRT